MLTKYFSRAINTQKYRDKFQKDVFFSHVGRLSLSGFDEMFWAVGKTRTSPAEKAEQERKRSHIIYAPRLRELSCVSLAGKAKLSMEFKM